MSYNENIILSKDPNKREEAVMSLINSKNKPSFKHIEFLKNDDDYNVRMAFLKLSSYYLDDDTVEPIIINMMLNDDDELVRIEAQDVIFGNFNSLTSKVVTTLFDLTSKKYKEDELFCRNAYQIIGKFGSHKDVILLKKILKSEKREQVLIGIYNGLYDRHKDGIILKRILSLMNSKDYTIRCAVANTLADIYENSNDEKVLKFLKECLKSENTIAGKSSIKNAINDIATTEASSPQENDSEKR
jgi:hypothetical protein